jgi:hypothetical protein
VPVGPSITVLVAVAEGAGAGLGAGAGAGTLVVIGAGAGCGAGAAFGATLRAVGRFFGFALFAVVRLGARVVTALFFALGVRFFDRAAVFSTRFFVFALLFDFALLLGLADRFAFAFLAMHVAPLLRWLTASTVAVMRQSCETHWSPPHGTNFLRPIRRCAHDS